MDIQSMEAGVQGSRTDVDGLQMLTRATGGVAWISARPTVALENIRTLLHSAGATMAQVTECTVFLVDMADYAAMNSVYIEFFKTAPPARATLAVTALPRPAARVEIKCSAVVPD